MGFSRQLDILVAILGAIVVFVGCIFMIGIPIKISLVFAVGVLFAGVVFGRRVVEFVMDIF